MAMCLGTLAMIPENVNRIMKFGGVPPLVELMHMVSGMPSCPAQEEILSALSLAMREILGNVPAVEEIVDPSTLLNASLSIPQNHPKKTTAVANSMLLTRRILAMCGELDLGEFPVVDSTVTGLRSNLAEQAVAEAGLGILYAATKQLTGDVLWQQNGTRIVVQLISALSDERDEKCLKALTEAMLIIEIVTKTEEGKDALAKQVRRTVIVDKIDILFWHALTMPRNANMNHYYFVAVCCQCHLQVHVYVRARLRLHPGVPSRARQFVDYF